MIKKILALLIVLILIANAAFSMCQIQVGVKAGDWIEYKVYTTGVPAEGHEVVWAKMEILSVIGNEITVNTTTQDTNGALSSVAMTLNPEKGKVDIWAIIPAGLSKGEMFFDESMGDVPIHGEEQRVYEGVQRETTFFNSSERFKLWDKQTGVFLEGTDTLPTYSLTAVFDKTNMWNTQIWGLNPTVFYFLVFALLIGVTVAITLIMLRRKNPRQQTNNAG